MKKQFQKTIWIALLTIVFVVALAITVGAKDAVSYLSPVYQTDGDPESGIVRWETKTVTDYWNLTSDDAPNVWASGWRVVTGDVVLSAGVSLSGDVNLILCDGATLTVIGDTDCSAIGIDCTNKLTIYGQELGTGKLYATGNGAGSGIGKLDGSTELQPTNVTVNGGTVYAQGGTWQHAIGTGPVNLIVNDGVVYATAGEYQSEALKYQKNGNTEPFQVQPYTIFASGSDAGTIEAIYCVESSSDVKKFFDDSASKKYISIKRAEAYVQFDDLTGFETLQGAIDAVKEKFDTYGTEHTVCLARNVYVANDIAFEEGQYFDDRGYHVYSEDKTKIGVVSATGIQLKSRVSAVSEIYKTITLENENMTFEEALQIVQGCIQNPVNDNKVIYSKSGSKYNFMYYDNGWKASNVKEMPSAVDTYLDQGIYVVGSVVDRVKYTVTETVAQNGTVSVGTSKEIYDGKEVTITVTPAEGYALNTLKVYQTGNDTVLVSVEDQKNTFDMPTYNVTIEATFVPKIDVSEQATGVFGTALTRQINGMAKYLNLSPKAIEEFLVAWAGNSANATAKLDDYKTATTVEEAKQYAILYWMVTEIDATDKTFDDPTMTDRVRCALNSDIFMKKLSALAKASSYGDTSVAVLTESVKAFPSVVDEIQKMMDEADNADSFIRLYTKLNKALTEKPSDSLNDVQILKNRILGVLTDETYELATKSEWEGAFEKAIALLDEKQSIKTAFLTFDATLLTADEATQKDASMQFAILERIAIIQLLYSFDAPEEIESASGGTVKAWDVRTGLLESDVMFKVLAKHVEAVATDNVTTVLSTCLSLFPATKDEFDKVTLDDPNEKITDKIIADILLSGYFYTDENKTPATSATTNHGSISFTESSLAGKTVEITVTPATGYELSKLVYNDGTEHKITAGLDGKYTYVRNAVFGTVTATFKKTDATLFAEYQEEQNTALDTLGEDCDDVIATAKSEIDALTYDKTKTLDENKARVDAIASVVALNLNQAKWNEYKAEKKAELDELDIEYPSVIANAKSAIDDLTYDETKDFDDNQDAVDVIVSAVPMNVNKAKWNEYKTEKKAELDALGEDYAGVIDEAKGTIDALTYDETQSLAKNKDVVDTLTKTAKTSHESKRKSYSPTVISGAKQTIDMKQKNVVAAFRSEANFNEFVKVTVDGVEVAPENYTVVEGSIVVTFHAPYLKKLSGGTHQISIISQNGHADTEFTIVPKPSLTWLWIILSVLGIAVVVYGAGYFCYRGGHMDGTKFEKFYSFLPKTR